jgi:hypothetical protein
MQQQAWGNSQQASPETALRLQGLGVNTYVSYIPRHEHEKVVQRWEADRAEALEQVASQQATIRRLTDQVVAAERNALAYKRGQVLWGLMAGFSLSILVLSWAF